MKNPRALRWFADLVRPRNYVSMLITAITLVLIGPLIDNTPWGRVTMFVLVALSLLSATVAISDRKHEKIIGGTLGGLTLGFVAITSCLHNGFFASDSFWVIGDCVAFFFFVAVAGIMMRDIFAGDVTGNRICGAICVYLLMGLAFAMLQMAIFNLDNTALKFDHSLSQQIKYDAVIGRPPIFSMLLYFSFCTLTTVGYGDISPVSALSRTLAWLEALAGQLYLTVLVARLVGQHIASSASRSPID
jgi:hypothetical protein